MKRLALLLAAVGLGSGCVVETNTTCDRSLTVSWAFVDATGRSNLACGDAGLSQAIYDVDLYVDGVPVAAFVPCTDYAASILGLSSGSHDVMVEGFDFASNVITRDAFTAFVASCGDTPVAAAPGEGIIEFLPNTCSLLSHPLTYELEDVTRSPNYVISAIYPTSASLGTYTCSSGIAFAVPYGYYNLNGIEETSSSGLTVFNSKCSVTAADVLTWGVTSFPIAWTGSAACF